MLTFWSRLSNSRPVFQYRNPRLGDAQLDWFYLSGTGLPRLTQKRGHKTGAVVVVVVAVVV